MTYLISTISYDEVIAEQTVDCLLGEAIMSARRQAAENPTDKFPFTIICDGPTLQDEIVWLLSSEGNVYTDETDITAETVAQMFTFIL